MALVGLLGFIGSGKGTVAEHLVENYNFKQDSFASSLKDACAVIFDWPRDLLEGDTDLSRTFRETVDEWWSQHLSIPDFTPRLGLQLMGTDAIRNHFHADMWLLTAQNRLRKNPDQNVVISDVRFPNEINLIKELGGTLITVRRGKIPKWYGTAVSANKGNRVAIAEMNHIYPEVHASEWAWVGVGPTDHLISNNGTMEKLKLEVDAIFSTP